MKYAFLLTLGLIALGSPVLGQQKAPAKRKDKPQASSSVGKQPGAKQSETQQDQAADERINLQNNPRFNKRVGKDAIDKDSAAAPLDQPPVLKPKVIAAPAYAGSPRSGLKEIERLAREGRGQEAAALAEDLIERVAITTQSERLQAELRYAAGVAQSMAGQLSPAAHAFRSASALAGPGDLRLDSLYNTAVQHIEQGELYYEQIPEILAQEMAKGGSMAVEADTTKPDTLPQAREEYRRGREVLIARLRRDWRDEDTRANIEFIQRRLDELDRIESKREDPTSQEKSKEGQESEKTEEGEGGDKGAEEREQDSDEAGDVGSNSADTDEQQTDNSDPKEGEGAKEGNQDPNPEAEADENSEVEKQEQQDTGMDDENSESESGGQEADAEMSQEEVKLILDRLNELDKRAKQLRAALYKTRRIRVDRDW